MNRAHDTKDCWCRHDGSHSGGGNELILCKECDRSRPLELQLVTENRRRYERVNIPQPIRTSVDGKGAHVVDASIGGVGLLHYDKSVPPGAPCRVLFHSEFGPITLFCEVARTAPNHETESTSSGNVAWQTGLKIVAADPESVERLRRLVLALQPVAKISNDH